MAMWESWRYEIDRTTRIAEQGRSERAAAPLHEAELRAERTPRPDTAPRPATSGWLHRVAQAAAGWAL